MIAEYLARHALSELWALAWHFGILGAIIAACIVLQFFPAIPPRIRQFAVMIGIAAVIMFVTAGVYTKLGADYVQAKWNAEAAAAVSDATKARRDAETTFPPDTGEHADKLRDDPWDRDQDEPKAGSSPGLRAAHPLFGVKRHR